jgi:hypothetical protein
MVNLKVLCFIAALRASAFAAQCADGSCATDQAALQSQFDGSDPSVTMLQKKVTKSSDDSSNDAVQSVAASEAQALEDDTAEMNEEFEEQESEEAAASSRRRRRTGPACTMCYESCGDLWTVEGGKFNSPADTGIKLRWKGCKGDLMKPRPLADKHNDPGSSRTTNWDMSKLVRKNVLLCCK